jgi:predicted ATPase
VRFEPDFRLVPTLLYSLASFLASAIRQISVLASTVSENAVLGGVWERQTPSLSKASTAELTKLLHV